MPVARVAGMEADKAHGVSLHLRDLPQFLHMSGRPAGRIFSVTKTRERADRVRVRIVVRRCSDRRMATLAGRPRDLAGERSSRREACHKGGGRNGKAEPRLPGMGSRTYRPSFYRRDSDGAVRTVRGAP